MKAFRTNKRARAFVAEVLDTNEPFSDMNSFEKLCEEVEVHLAEDEINKSDSKNSTYFFHIGQVLNNDRGTLFTATIAQAAVFHAITAKVPFYKGSFMGIMLDTGVAKSSSGSKEQYLAYCSMMGQQTDIDQQRARSVRFGIGTVMSLGMAIIEVPIERLWLSFDMHVVKADVPILVCIEDMDYMGVYLNRLEDKLVHPSSGTPAKIVRKNGHPFLVFSPSSSCFFTTVELKRLHRRFGNPSHDKLANLLDRADIEHVNSENRKGLRSIEQECSACQLFAQRPRRFKFKIRKYIDFNHSIWVDVFYIEKKPILHVVDEATNYQAEHCFKSMSSEEL